jgi:hypothetical protein
MRTALKLVDVEPVAQNAASVAIAFTFTDPGKTETSMPSFDGENFYVRHRLWRLVFSDFSNSFVS